MSEPLTKRDDQTLATIARISGYQPALGKKLVLKTDFDNPELANTIRNAWAQLDELEAKNGVLTSQDLFDLFNDETRVDHNNGHIRLMCHWLNGFTFRDNKIDYKAKGNQEHSLYTAELD